MLVQPLPPTFTTRTALDAGLSYRDLYQMRDNGELIELSRGVFRSVRAPAASFPDLGGRQSAVERSTPSEERQKLSGTPRLDSYLVGFGTRGGADSRLNTGQQPGAQALRRIVRLDPELNLGPLSFLLRQGPPQCDSRKDVPPLGCHDTARRHRAEQLRGHRPRQPRSGPTGPVSTRPPRRLDTLRIYSHPLPSADAQAAATIENMLAGGRWGLAVGGDPQTSSTNPAPSSAVMRRWPGSPPRRAG